MKYALPQSSPSLRDWLPGPLKKGPPLPAWLNVYWPWEDYRDWQSTDELQQWVDANAVVFVIADAAGNINFDSSSLDPAWDCVDYSRRLQRLAAQDGYFLSLALTDPNGNIGRGINVSPAGYHMGNLAIVGDEMWFVDAMTGTITDLGPLE
jgi:hypothetical protein